MGRIKERTRGLNQATPNVDQEVRKDKQIQE